MSIFRRIKENNNARLLTNSVVYTFFNVLQKVFSFFLLPLYTAYLTTADYGTTNLISSFNYAASFLCACSLYSAIMRYYIEYKDDKSKVCDFYSTIINFIFLFSVICFIIMMACKGILSKIAFTGIKFWPIVVLGLAQISFLCIYNAYSYILKVEEKATSFSIMSMVFFFFQLTCNIVSVVALKLGALGVIISTLISYVVFSLYAVIKLYNRGLYRLKFDFNILKRSLKYSIPLIPNDMATQIAVFVSKMFINLNSSLSTVGLFSVASQFGTVVDAVQSSANSAVRPWTFAVLQKDETDSKREIYNFTVVQFAVYTILFGAVALFSNEALCLLTSESYHSAGIYVALIVITYMIKMFYYYKVNLVLFYEKSAKKLFLATTLGSFANIILCAVLIPKLGIIGSIGSEFFAMVLRIGILLAISKRFVVVKNHDIKLYIMVIIAIAVSGIGYFITKIHPEVSLYIILIKFGLWILLGTIEIFIGIKEIKLFFSSTRKEPEGSSII